MTTNIYCNLRAAFFTFIFILTVAVPAGSADEINARPAMWLIEKGEAQVYFLGSVHLLPDEVNWYGESIKSVVDTAEEVVFEVHMTPEKQALSRQITLANGLLENGDLLSNHLDTDEFDYLIETAQSLGIPGASIAGFKPWFASVALSVSAIQKEGWKTDSGVDKFIEHQIVAQGTRISELETLEFQLSTLYDHPIDVQADMLKDTLEQLKDIKTVTLDMVGAWASGDEEMMEEAFINPMQEQREIYRKLVVTRNNNWLPVIDQLIAKPQKTLVVAGVAHFIGEDGLVKLLKQRGHTIKRIQ